MPPVGAQREPQRSVSETITLSFDGRERQYLLHLPASADGALVLAFHGGGLSGAQQQEASGLDAIADRERFIVAYPEGFERTWADGRGVLPADRLGIDGLLVSRLVCGADVVGIQGVADPAVPFDGGYIAGGPEAHRLPAPMSGEEFQITSLATRFWDETPFERSPPAFPGSAVARIARAGTAVP